eukprot:TRINITY_DN643_c0_g1_i2.p1 TRINITY_DN643_c0_g1~~TRINITY_DN643_c0_g1_i2.p1  ORF type:complete len:351 (+),score=22.79 TRINITY_DN643_c0_g1_i2:194-1246(+)
MDNNNVREQVMPNDHGGKRKRKRKNKGARLFDGCYLFSQLLQATMFFYLLDSKTALALAVTSKAMLKLLTPLIITNFTFTFKKDRQPLRHYNPQLLKISSSDYAGLLRSFAQLMNLRELSFWDCFNLPLAWILAPTDRITHIRFGDRWNQPLPLLHLPNLTHLFFGFDFTQDVDNKLPGSLTHLSLNGRFNQRVDFLPQGLTHLQLSLYFNHPVECLPGSLISLEFGDSFSQPVDKLPKGLKRLVFGRDFIEPVPKLPPSLDYLQFGLEWNEHIENFPKTLKHIIFGKKFNQEVDSLPEGLTHVVFGAAFRKRITFDVTQLKYVTIPRSYNLERPLLPSTCTLHINLNEN